MTRALAAVFVGLCAVAVALVLLVPQKPHYGFQALQQSWSQPADQLVTSPTIPAHLQYTWHTVEATP